MLSALRISFMQVAVRIAGAAGIAGDPASSLIHHIGHMCLRERQENVAQALAGLV